MSFTVTNWAKKQKTRTPTAKLILLLLADMADASGLCWPFQETLADLAGISVDTLQRKLRELEDLSLLSRSRQRRKAGGYRSTYVLHVPDSEPVEKQANKKDIGGVNSLKRSTPHRYQPMPQIERPRPQAARTYAASVRSPVQEPLREPSTETSELQSNESQVVCSGERVSAATWPEDQMQYLKEACSKKVEGDTGIFILANSEEWDAWSLAFKVANVFMMGPHRAYASAPDEPTEFAPRFGRYFAFRWPPGFAFSTAGGSQKSTRMEVETGDGPSHAKSRK